MMFNRVVISGTAAAATVGRRCRPIAAIVAIAASLLAVPAHAADLPFAPGPASLSYYRWEGGYVGAHVGYLFGDSDFGLTGFPAPAFAGLIPPIPTSTTAHANGVVGGLQAGYMHQIDAFVFGIEQDVILGTPTATSITSGVASGIPWGLTQQQELSWITTTRARVGYAPNDQFMFYATGGLALGGVNTTSTFGLGNGVAFTASRSDVRTGWAAGAGVEYALTPQFSAAFEYLHFDLGTVTVVGYPNIPGDFDTHTSAALRGDIVRVGINYRFDHDDMSFLRGGIIPQLQDDRDRDRVALLVQHRHDEQEPVRLHRLEHGVAPDLHRLERGHGRRFRPRRRSRERFLRQSLRGRRRHWLGQPQGRGFSARHQPLFVDHQQPARRQPALFRRRHRL